MDIAAVIVHPPIANSVKMEFRLPSRPRACNGTDYADGPLHDKLLEEIRQLVNDADTNIHGVSTVVEDQLIIVFLYDPSKWQVSRQNVLNAVEPF